MPVYEYECIRHGRFERYADMGNVRPVPCDSCGRYARKQISMFHFTEDRTRFWRSSDGSRFSSAFGQELPDSREGVAALARSRGFELDAHEMPHIKRAAEIGRAKRQGDTLSSKEVMSYVNEPRQQTESIVETMRRLGKERAVHERVQAGFENWPDRGVASASEMAKKGASVIGEGMAILNSGKPV